MSAVPGPMAEPPRPERPRSPSPDRDLAYPLIGLVTRRVGAAIAEPPTIGSPGDPGRSVQRHERAHIGAVDVRDGETTPVRGSLDDREMLLVGRRRREVGHEIPEPSKVSRRDTDRPEGSTFGGRDL